VSLVWKLCDLICIYNIYVISDIILYLRCFDVLCQISFGVFDSHRGPDGFVIAI
jgi:hypothetical protein